MALQFGPTKIGGMQYNGVTIGEAMMNGQVVYKSGPPGVWPQGFEVNGAAGATALTSWAPVRGGWGLTSPDVGVPTLFPHPDYPHTVITSPSGGISVPAGKYLIELTSETGGSRAGVRGLRATLNGSPIPGLQVQQNYSGFGFTVSVSGVVTIGAGVLSTQVYTDGVFISMRCGGSPNTSWLRITPA